IGLGLFISGIMAPGFFALGVVGIFGVPLVSLWTPQGAYLMHGGLGLLMALYAGWLRWRYKEQEAESMIR
ncbi:MAG: hypothetical protein NZ742_07960, partial [Acidobacteria bacterium]|nr:hypothetical protein [Acidobacteriota bacterium]MDW7985190.1 hypothetical protein [Acidobacteriota bacterium]